MFFRTSTGGLVIIGAALPKNGYEYLELKKKKSYGIHRDLVCFLEKKVQYEYYEQI